MLAFLGVDQSECACEDPCPSVGKFVKFYLYRPYVRFILEVKVVCMTTFRTFHW